MSTRHLRAHGSLWPALCLALTAGVRGQGTLRDALPGQPLRWRLNVESALRYDQEVPVAEQEVRLQTCIWEAELGAPLYEADGRRLVFRPYFHRRHHAGTPSLPDTGDPLPEDLYAIGALFSYSHYPGDRTGWVTSLNVGSASDKPFNSYAETAIDVLGYYVRPSGGPNAWLFGVAFSNNRAFLPYVPLPGVAYMWNSPKGCRAVIGLPFASCTYRPSAAWEWHAAANPSPGGTARVRYTPVRPLTLYAQLSTDRQGYFRTERDDAREHLFAFDHVARLGLIVRPARGLALELACDYAVARFYFEGRSYSDRNDNRIDLEDGLRARAALHWYFSRRLPER
ncbi:MAG: hypothetical protein JXR37_00295 [Kiritimatiellae bacterium]|nr:hypothetical protein [Kiritimatiellia bacterium]